MLKFLGKAMFSMSLKILFDLNYNVELWKVGNWYYNKIKSLI